MFTNVFEDSLQHSKLLIFKIDLCFLYYLHFKLLDIYVLHYTFSIKFIEIRARNSIHFIEHLCWNIIYALLLKLGWEKDVTQDLPSCIAPITYCLCRLQYLSSIFTRVICLIPFQKEKEANISCDREHQKVKCVQNHIKGISCFHIRIHFLLWLLF